MDTVYHYSLKKDIDAYRRRGMYSRLISWKIRLCHVCIDTPSQSEAHFFQRYLHSAHDLETVVVCTPPLASAHKCGFECGLLFLVPTPQVPWVALVSNWGQTEGWLLAVWVGSAKERKNNYTPSNKWSNESNVEKSHKSTRVCPMFYPSLRGPPEVWHHSWIQLSLKHLQLKG